MHKYKTAKQRLAALLKDLHPIEYTIIRERLLMIAEETKMNIAAEPDKWGKSIITPELYLNVMNKIIEQLKFDEL